MLCQKETKPKKKGKKAEGNSLKGTTTYYYYTGNYSLHPKIQVILGILLQINKEVKWQC